MSAVKSIFCVPKTFLENFIGAFRHFHKNILLFSKNLRNIVLHAEMPETSLIFPLPWIMTNPSCASHAFPRLLIPETKINCWITLKEEETNKKKRIAGAKHTPSRVKEKVVVKPFWCHAQASQPKRTTSSTTEIAPQRLHNERSMRRWCGTHNVIWGSLLVQTTIIMAPGACGGRLWCVQLPPHFTGKIGKAKIIGNAGGVPGVHGRHRYLWKHNAQNHFSLKMNSIYIHGNPEKHSQIWKMFLDREKVCLGQNHWFCLRYMIRDEGPNSWHCFAVLTAFDVICCCFSALTCVLEAIVLFLSADNNPETIGTLFAASSIWWRSWPIV